MKRFTLLFTAILVFSSTLFPSSVEGSIQSEVFDIVGGHKEDTYAGWGDRFPEEGGNGYTDWHHYIGWSS